MKTFINRKIRKLCCQENFLYRLQIKCYFVKINNNFVLYPSSFHMQNGMKLQDSCFPEGADCTPQTMGTITYDQQPFNLDRCNSKRLYQIVIDVKRPFLTFIFQSGSQFYPLAVCSFYLTNPDQQHLKIIFLFIIKIHMHFRFVLI